jgi:quinol monooxygenase YgiN
MTTDANAAAYTLSYIEVAPSSAAEVGRYLQQWSEAARKAPGLTRLEVLRRTTPAHHFALIASWTGSGAFQTARESGVGKTMRDWLAPHLIAGIDTRIHGGMIGGDDPRGSGKATVVVTHVDVPPPNKDACIGLLEAQIKPSRAEAGSRRFEVFQQADRPNHFSVVESWASQAAYDAHIVTAHTRSFRQQLTPLSGALYDERIYTGIA